jgi:hypothetical protein
MAKQSYQVGWGVRKITHDPAEFREPVPVRIAQSGRPVISASPAAR